MRLFGFGCIHNWEVLDKTEMPSAFAQLRSDPRIAKAMLLSTSGYTAPSIGLYMFQSE